MKAEELKERTRLLEDMQNLVLELKSQMNYFREPLFVIFGRTAEKSSSKAFQLPFDTLVEFEEKSGEMAEIWSQKACQMYRNTALNSQDQEIIIHIGTYLGQTDYENQQMQFQYTEDRLTRQLTESRLLYQQKGSMYRKTGFFVGIIVSLVLL